MIAAGVFEPHRGWGGILGLGVAVLICCGIWKWDEWRTARAGKIGNHSPTPPAVVGGVPKPLVVDRTSHETGETAGPTEEEWYGGIIEVDGVFRRFYRKVGHIARTGDSPPPDDDVEDDADEYDDECEDEPGGNDVSELPGAYVAPAAVLPDAPVREPRPEAGVTPAVYAARMVREGRFTTAQIVAELQDVYGVSRATAYRAVGSSARPPREMINRTMVGREKK